MNNGIAGVYAITNTITGDRYIGSTADFYRRKGAHLRGLRSFKHGNQHLQSAWGKYGESSFTFGMLSILFELDQLIPCEQIWLDTYIPEYNIVKVAGAYYRGYASPFKGVPRSPEVRAKLSAAMRGKKTAKGCKRSDETRDKIRRANLGKKLSESTKLKVSLNKRELYLLSRFKYIITFMENEKKIEEAQNA